MKFLPLVFLLCLLSGPVMADDVNIVRHDGDETIELPGNATIVTGPGHGPSGVVIYNNDESLLYRTLVGPYARRNYNYVPNASLNDVNSICAGADTTMQRNKCIRDVIEEREKLQRRYND